MHTVGSAAEARRRVDDGVDVIVAQGIESGGHVWGQVSAMALVPAVLDMAGPVPVVAAGGMPTPGESRQPSPWARRVPGWGPASSQRSSPLRIRCISARCLRRWRQTPCTHIHSMGAGLAPRIGSCVTRPITRSGSTGPRHPCGAPRRGRGYRSLRRRDPGHPVLSRRAPRRHGWPDRSHGALRGQSAALVRTCPPRPTWCQAWRTNPGRHSPEHSRPSRDGPARASADR